LHNRSGAHLEITDVLEALLTVGIPSHEPLRQAAFGVTDDQRYTTHQLRTRSDFGVGVFEQFIAPVQAAVSQAEHICQRTTIDDVQPLLTWIDINGFDRFSHVRQFNALLLAGGFAGHHVLFLSYGENM
jgi:hypothetical protein